MIHSAQKLIQNQQGLGNQIRRTFSRLGKHEKMIKKNPHVQDYTQNPIVKVNIDEARTQFKRDNTVDGIKLLSEASQRSKKEVKFGKELRIDKQKINKEIKKFSNKAIDKAQEDSYDYLVDNDYLQLNMSKIEENKRLIKELKEFKKLYFEKKEIKRLLKQQDRKQQNYLPHNLIGQEDIENAQRFHAYKESSNNVKNQRIQNMLEGGSKENKKLSLLISSGLLDTSKNIKQIIATSTELLLQDMKKNPQQFSKSNDNVYEEVVIDMQNNEEENQDIDISNEQQHDDLTFADKMIINNQNQSENSLQQVSQQQDKQKMLEIYGEKISQMGFDITLDEMSFVNFETLALFFDEFVNSTPDEKMKTLSKIQVLDNLRSYENYLFDKYRNNDISLRVKGRLEFKDLTEKENLNYIKYNIKKPSELFLMMQNLPEQQLSPSIVSQGVSKIATFKFQSKENYLAVISNFNYRALLRNCVNTCSQMSDSEFVDMIWSLGKIHKDEHGIVYERLFNKLMSVTSDQLKVKINTSLQLNKLILSFLIKKYYNQLAIYHILQLILLITFNLQIEIKLVLLITLKLIDKTIQDYSNYFNYKNNKQINNNLLPKKMFFYLIKSSPHTHSYNLICTKFQTIIYYYNVGARLQFKIQKQLVYYKNHHFQFKISSKANISIVRHRQQDDLLSTFLYFNYQNLIKVYFDLSKSKGFKNPKLFMNYLLLTKGEVRKKYLVRGETQKIFFNFLKRDISFLSRGYVKLHHLALNQELNSIVLNEIKQRLESRQGEELTVFGIQGLMLYMSFLDTRESKELMANYLLPLLSKENIISELDNVSLSEICQALASICSTHKNEISQYLEDATPQLIKISKQLKTDTISDLMVVASACYYQNKALFQELKKRTLFNFREQKECSETSISKILCSFAQFDVVKSLQLHVDVKESSNTNLTDNLLLFSYFPTLIFHQQSPQYIFYNKLAKEIDQVKDKMSQKWISMSLFGIASAQYKNCEFIDDCVKQVLQNQEILDENGQKSPAANTNLNELAMILFSYSNMKRSNEWSRNMIERIRNLFMENKFRKATPIAWAQFFNALSNTNQEKELDEVEQQFAEVVYFDKIQPHIHVLTQNMIISLLFSFSRLKVEQDILVELASYIQFKKLSNFQIYILNLGLQLGGLTSIQNIPQLSTSSAQPRIKEVELYIKDILAEKLDFYGNQRFNYKQVSNQVKQILYEITSAGKKEGEQETILENYFDEKLNLMIDLYLPQSKKAIFIYTYDNCLMQEHTDKRSISNNQLSGLFQAKETILMKNQISVSRLFTHEYNLIGIKSSFEEEKLQKKKFVENLLSEK